MTPEQIHLTQSSFIGIMENSEKITEILHAELFHKAPELRSIFPIDTEYQKMRLIITLGAAVNMLHAPRRLEQTLRNLGVRYFHYGVKFNHYEIFGTALLKAFSVGLADDWNNELKGAWAAFYVKVSYEMQTGMQADQCAA